MTCPPDNSWAGISYNLFSPPNPLLMPALFFGTTLVKNSMMQDVPSHLYLGVHVQGVDQFNTNDVLTLFFDSNNDGTFDFALKYEIGPSTTPTSDTACDQPTHPTPPSNTRLFKFTSGTWQEQFPLPPETTLKQRTAYNFTLPTAAIWELEIDLDLAALGVPVSPNGIRFGAKLFLPETTNFPQLFVWPPGLTTDANPIHSDPGGDPQVTPTKLDTRTIAGAPPCTGDVRLISIKSRANNLDDAFYIPKDTDFSGDTLPDQFQTRLFADVTYVNPSKLPDTSAVTTNQGDVHFRLFPWGAGPLDTVDVGKDTLSFQQLDGIAQTARQSWPKTKTDWDNHKAFFNKTQSTHVCLKVNLENFPTNAVVPDESQINLTYTSLSTRRDTFLIRAPGTVSPGAPKEDYFLHVRWENLPPDQYTRPGKKEHWWHRWWHCLADWFHKRKRWEAHFVNAAALGLQPVGNGYYSLRLAPGEEVQAEIELTGVEMPTPSQGFHVSPRAGGQLLQPASGEAALEVPIIPGGIITIVARGLIAVMPDPSGTLVSAASHNANGFIVPRLVEERFLLSRVWTPWQHVGSLIAAFKPDFSDSFVVGTEGTFFVPPDASKLYLAVNDIAGGYGDNSGQGFDVNVVATPPVTLPTKLSWPANPQLGLPGLPQPAANLPLLTIDVLRVDQAQKAVQPIGYVAYAVYATHGGRNDRAADPTKENRP
jgi:hypothetical protein